MALRTWDPHHPEWASDTAEQASEHERLAFGMLIEKGPKTATKQLVVLHTDDGGEQAGHRVIQHMIEELLSDSALALRLLNTFSFLFLPVNSQQVARDGWSRFGYDCPPPGRTYLENGDGNGNATANGITRTGESVQVNAIANWLSDHPDPANGLFCEGAFHCDIGQYPLLHQAPNTANPAVSPYAAMWFPNGGLSKFRDEEGAWSSVMWPEFIRPDSMRESPTPFGVRSQAPAKFYFEVPWRHAGHHAMFRYEDDAHKVWAQSFLSGLATVADASIYFEGPAELTEPTGIAVSGYKVMEGPVVVSEPKEIEVLGEKFTSGGVALTASSDVVVEGRKYALGYAVVTDNGLQVVGEKFIEGPAELTDPANIVVQGTSQEYREGVVEVTDSAVIVVSGILVKDSPPIEVRDEAQITVRGIQVYESSVVVTDLASIAVQGLKVTSQPTTRQVKQFNGRLNGRFNAR